MGALQALDFLDFGPHEEVWFGELVGESVGLSVGELVGESRLAATLAAFKSDEHAFLVFQTEQSMTQAG